MLNISPINFTRITNNFAKANQPIKQGLAQDVFVKSTNNVSFKGNEVQAEKSDFVKWAEETDFVNKQLKNILTNDNLKIGEGNSHTAFNIPGNDDYILRIGTSALKYMNMGNIEKATLEDSGDNLDINVGQKVASISVPSDFARPNEPDWLKTEIEIMKKQSGESIGVQPPETLVTGEFVSVQKEGVLPYEDPSRKEKYARTIHQVAELPIESYEKLIKDFQTASEKGFHFDHLNSNNLLVDAENQSVNFIDMEKGSEPVKPSYSNLIYSLTNIQYYDTYTSQYCNDRTPEQKEAALKDTVQIINKFLQAMENTGAKFNRNDHSYEFTISFANSVPCAMSAAYGLNGFFEYAATRGLVEGN